MTEEKAPGLIETGMITSSAWADYDNDGDEDLVVTGEYMPVRIFQNDDGKFSEKTDEAGLGKPNGWWQSLHPVDIDHDGDIDFIAGNHGLNSRFKATEDHPVVMFINDFDRNGNVEQIICRYEGDSL